MQQNRDRAFSYIELLVVVACMTILLTAAIPAWLRNQSGNHLILAAETMAQDLRSARSLTLSRNTPYYLHYDNHQVHTAATAAEDWCYILSAEDGCHCLDAASLTAGCVPQNDRTAKTVHSGDYPGVHLIEARFGNQHSTWFNPVRGTARFGHLSLGDDFERRLQINISMIGRIRICRPHGLSSLGPYPLC